MKLLASAKELFPNKVPKHRFGDERKKKTSKATNTLIKREVQKNPQLRALELKNLHPELLENVAVRNIQHCLQKGLGMPSRKAAKKPLVTERMKKQRIAFAKKNTFTGHLRRGKQLCFQMRVIFKCSEQGRSQLHEIGGAKLKSGGQS